MKRLAIVLMSLSLLSFKPVPQTYVERLKDMQGMSYWRYNCAQFVETAARKQHCGAIGMWNGCNGQAIIVAEYVDLSSAKHGSLQAGDILAINKKHVVVYVGNNTFMDSDFNHGGVGYVREVKDGPWFSGPVRVIRWKALGV